MEDRLYRKAITVFGESNQLFQATEEMAELIQQISKQNRKIGQHEDLVEELADTYIMLEQVEMICNVSETEIELYIKRKRERLKQKLKG